MDDKLKQNETKQKLRTLFKAIDEKKSGAVPPSVFFEILELHKVDLT
jgi:Ca2+-binding EF-hand superfamily protein